MPIAPLAARVILPLVLLAPCALALGPDAAAVRGEPGAASGAAVGIEAVATSSAPSSAGAVGEALGTSGATWGARGVANSPDGVAGQFEADGGGDPMLALGPGGSLFLVDASGALAAAAFAGDGSQLVGGAALICTGCIGSGDLAAGAVTAGHLPANAVGSVAIQDGAITDLKLATGAVGDSELADGSVGTSELADRTLTAAHVGTWAVTAAKLASNTVTGEKLAQDAISLRRIDEYDVALEIYQVHDDCDEAGEPTRETGCRSLLCGAFPVRFLDCGGGCTAASQQICFNEYIGLALHDSE